MKITRKERAINMTKAVTDFYVDKLYSVHKEFGLNRGNRRMDLLAVNMKGKFICIEVKTCRADYTTDSKWREYLPFCNQMYIAIPQKFYDSSFFEQLENDVKPHKVGIILVTDRNKCVVVKSAANRVVSDKIMMDHFIKMAWRGGESKRTRTIERRERRRK